MLSKREVRKITESGGYPEDIPALIASLSEAMEALDALWRGQGADTRHLLSLWNQVPSEEADE